MELLLSSFRAERFQEETQRFRKDAEEGFLCVFCFIQHGNISASLREISPSREGKEER
jgi:hypothetical protein